MNDKEIIIRESRYVEAFIRRNINSKPLFKIAEELNGVLGTSLVSEDIDILAAEFEIYDAGVVAAEQAAARKAEKSAKRRNFWGGVAKAGVVLGSAAIISSNNKKK